MDHSTMDHSSMEHSTMEHSTMKRCRFDAAFLHCRNTTGRKVVSD